MLFRPSHSATAVVALTTAALVGSLWLARPARALPAQSTAPARVAGRVERPSALRRLGSRLTRIKLRTCAKTRRLVRKGRARLAHGRARLARACVAVVRGAATAKRVSVEAVKAIPGAAKKAGRWARKNPGKAIGIGLGTAAMFATVFYAAPALATGISGWLTPVVGKTAASIVGIASGGALASGSRSLLVHTAPMVLKIDPFNGKQLATDVGMSSAFGFGGFAQAAALTQLTKLTGATGVGLFAANFVGLIGYEIFKDYLQNRIRSKVANDPKRFRDIWKASVLMETATNLHRCIPGLGLETNFGAKIVGDLGGTIWWDRIVNKRNDAGKGGRKSPSAPRTDPAHDALTE